MTTLHTNLPDMPPVTPCPAWCTETYHPWEPDADEWNRPHWRPFGDSVTAIELYAVDSYCDGTFTPGEPTLFVGGEPLDRTEAQALLEAARIITRDN